MKRKAIVFLLLVCIATFFAGCSDRTEPVVVSLEIKPNSFKTRYEVDEKLNFDNIFVLVTYDNGETEYIQCTSGMIIGFDSSTTGDKELYVEYGGKQSPIAYYEVVYLVDNSKQIKTNARLMYNTAINGEMLSYEINYYCGDLVDVHAIMFDLTSKNDIGIGINDTLNNVSFEVVTGWSYGVRWVSEQKMRILFYNKHNEQGIKSNTLFRINVNNGNKQAAVALENIEVSTLETAAKYYIPDFVR